MAALSRSFVGASQLCISIFMLLAALFIIIPPTDWAYDMAGHYYTHAAILSHAYTNSVDPFRLTESFCAELPDLAYELDATVQRVRVLKDSQYQWGMIGRCTTRPCVHMVAVQFYLHGLTGTRPESVRSAATTMINILEDRIKQLRRLPGQKSQQEIINIWCMRGFAIHLLGDTYAHTMLGDTNTLYKLGLGHAKDKHEPDYVFRRGETHWVNWVNDLSAYLGANNLQTAQIKAVKPAKPNTRKKSEEEQLQDECAIQTQLTNHANKDWIPWLPQIEDWAASACPTQPQSRGTVDIFSGLWSPRLNTCQNVIERGPDTPVNTVRSLANVLGTLPIPLPVPQCDKVWEGYLALAYDIFNSQQSEKSFWGSENKLNPEDLSYWGCDPMTSKDILADGGYREEGKKK
jgi:hypothetical protein